MMARHPARRRQALPPGPAKPAWRYPPELIAAVGIALAIAMWSYWPIVAGLSHTLHNSSDYSAGQLVPLVAIFFVWRDRKALGELPLVPCWRGGLAILLAAEVARICGFLSMRPSIEQYATVLALAGIILLIAGWQVFRRVQWLLLFLFLMMPLPSMIHSRISPPLQTLATTGSVFLIEACGICVTRQGNILMLADVIPIAVAEACSGLRMLTAFIIVAAFIAYMVKRPRWEKGVLLASSIPVAVICNMFRIFVTALIMLYGDAELAAGFFHDFAGFVMMPVAISLLFAELRLLDRLIVPESCEKADHTSTESRSRETPRVVFARRRQQAL